MFKQYKKDIYFLLKYNSANAVLLGFASLLLFQQWSPLASVADSWILLLCILPLSLPNLWTITGSAIVLASVAVSLDLFSVSLGDWWLLPLGAVIGLQSAWLMHNAAHESIKPRWLNRLLGEICGLQQLMGFPGWAIPHIVHHQFSDDPDKDPHPPQYLTFMQFLAEMGPSMARVARQFFFNLWKDHPQVSRIWQSMVWTSMAARYMRAVFLLVLLGPKIFVLCFMVSKMVNMIWYVHFNYYTHRPTGDGRIEILNLDHNFYYKLMNATMAGVYYHKNHHAKASLFDPRDYDKDSSKPLISYTHAQESILNYPVVND
jgi:fatty acid desaturase